MRDSGNPKSRFAESLKKIGISLLKLFRGDFPVFLLFLFITSFIWWSQTMSQNYDGVLRIPVRITDIPDDVRVIASPAGQITVSIYGKGATLRKSGRKVGRRILQVSNSRFQMNQGHAAIPTQWLRDSIAAMLPSSVTIRSVEPDSLVYLYALQHRVLLPVEYDGNTESQDQFFMERIEFQPDSVMAQVLINDTVRHSLMVDIENVTVQTDTTVVTASLKPVPGVIPVVDKVQMTVISQQYTEKSLEVPVTGVNFPDSISLKSFPSKAVVTVWVKLSEYDKLSARDFQVVVDYNDISGSNASKAPLRIYSQPVGVRNVRLQTRTVDFLMESRYY